MDEDKMAFLRAASEAGLVLESWPTNPLKPAMWHGTPAALHKFAALIEAAERERCAAICESIYGSGPNGDATQEECAAAIRAQPKAHDTYGASKCSDPAYKQKQADKSARMRKLLDETPVATIREANMAVVKAIRTKRK